MHEKGYPFKLIPGELIYKFESVSTNKRIQKAVLFTTTEREWVFNLALVDVDEDNQMRDDVESKNGDLVTVLATVFRIVEHFLKIRPNCVVMFRSNDDRRQRLYRIVLSRQLSYISEKFGIFGGQRGKAVPFIANTDYEQYYIKLHEYEGDQNI